MSHPSDVAISNWNLGSEDEDRITELIGTIVREHIGTALTQYCEEQVFITDVDERTGRPMLLVCGEDAFDRYGREWELRDVLESIAESLLEDKGMMQFALELKSLAQRLPSSVDTGVDTEKSTSVTP